MKWMDGGQAGPGIGSREGVLYSAASALLTARVRKVSRSRTSSAPNVSRLTAISDILTWLARDSSQL